MIVKYRNLQYEMSEKRLRQEDLQNATGLSQRSLASRMTGKTQWRLNEMMAIRDAFFPTKTIEYLFF